MKIEILEKKRVFDGFFKIDEATLRHEKFNGEMSENMRRLNFERGDSVAAIVFDPVTRELLFVEQFRYPVYSRSNDKTIIELIAGMVEEGELYTETLQREIKEELGYEMLHYVPLGSYFLSPGGSSERIHLFFVRIGKKIGNGGGCLEENEDIKIVRIKTEKISSISFNDAKTQLGLELSKEFYLN